MLKDISKKLTMKKTFFVTQLEGFFNAISHEYQELIHQKEIENAALQEKMTELEKDVKNLVEIKNRLLKEVSIEKEHVNTLQNELKTLQNNNKSDFQHKLIVENQELKKKIDTKEQNESQAATIKSLQEQIKKLQQIISKGSSYKNTLQDQNQEALIEEISKSLKK